MAIKKYVVGQSVFLQALLTDPTTGDPDDPSTQTPVDDPTIIITVYAPDGTNSTPSVAHAGTGLYTSTVIPSQQGDWTWATNSTGAASGAWKRQFIVVPVP